MTIIETAQTTNRTLNAQLTVDPCIPEHLAHASRVLEDTLNECCNSIQLAARTIANCFQDGGKLLICGNGGSAAESQHMAAELTHRLSAAVNRRALPALALTTDTSILTACSNDDGFDYVFARQVEAFGCPGDVLLGISTSGQSANVLSAFRQARQQGLQLVALCGRAGELLELADVAIAIPCDNAQHVQEAHLPIIHIICGLVERNFVTSEPPQGDELANPRKRSPR